MTLREIRIFLSGRVHVYIPSIFLERNIINVFLWLWSECRKTWASFRRFLSYEGGINCSFWKGERYIYMYIWDSYSKMLLIQENYWKLKNKGLCSSEFSGMINVFEIKRILFIKRFKVDSPSVRFYFCFKIFLYTYIRLYTWWIDSFETRHLG